MVRTTYQKWRPWALDHNIQFTYFESQPLLRSLYVIVEVECSRIMQIQFNAWASLYRDSISTIANKERFAFADFLTKYVFCERVSPQPPQQLARNGEWVQRL